MRLKNGRKIILVRSKSEGGEDGRRDKENAGKKTFQPERKMPSATYIVGCKQWFKQGLFLILKDRPSR